MKTKLFTTLTLFTLLFGTLFITSTIQSTSAVGTVSTDVKAGNNYWFNVASFPSLQELIDMSGANDNATVQLTATGGLQGSDFYVKVMSVNEEPMTYFNGNANVTANNVPTVDITLGLITGGAITLGAKNVTDNTVISTTALPAGIGLPVPAVFGTSTYLNITNFSQKSFIPLPLVLNNDWVVHATNANQFAAAVAAEGIGSVTVTDDSSQFKIAFDVTVNEDDSTAFKGHVAWSKTDGVATQLVFTPYNASTNVDIFSTIDITLDTARNENIPVLVEVGDAFTLKVDQADFDFTTTGFDSADDPAGDFTNIQASMAEYVGETLMDVKVTEVKGMYYRIEGDAFNGTGKPRVAIPGGPGEAWMVGFGRLGPGMIMSGLGDGGGNNTGPSLDSLALNIISHDELRTNIVPGFVVSEDYKIYAAWDKTISFFVNTGLTSFLATLQEIEENEYFQLYSSTSADPVITASYTGGEQADGSYVTELNVNVDVTQMMNDTYSMYDQYGFWIGDTWEKTTVSVIGNFNEKLTHAKHGSLDAFKITGAVDVTATSQDVNGTYGPSSVSISNFVIDLNGTMTRVNPIVDPVSTTTTAAVGNGTSEAAPGFDLPGFEAGLSILSFVVIAIVYRRRR